MPFQFSLEAALRLRRSQQSQQELALQRANEQVSRIGRELEAIERESDRIAQSTKKAKQITGAELHFGSEHLRVLARRVLEAQRRLEQARAQQAAAAEGFRNSWQRREALEALRRHEQETFRFDAGRREQWDIDDAFLQRFPKRQFLPHQPGNTCR
jgi:flagellar export protein FliJ